MNVRKPNSAGLNLESLENRAMLTTFFVASGESIQDAIDAAADSGGRDTVMILSGVYEENLIIDDAQHLTIKGIGDVTIRVDGDDDDVIKIDRAAKGLTIRNIHIEGGDRGIDSNDESELHDLVLMNVSTSGTDSDGLRIEKADGVPPVSSVTIKNSSFNNSLGGSSDGIDLSEIDSIRIIHSSAIGNGGQGLEIDDSGSIEVIGGEFSGNGEGLEIDDADSVHIVGGLFAGNDDEGLDIDSVVDIFVSNVTSRGNTGGSGLQIEAKDDENPIASIRILNSLFDDNGEDGIQIVEDDGVILDITLNGNLSTNNEFGLGYNIAPGVPLHAHGNQASGNGDDTLPS